MKPRQTESIAIDLIEIGQRHRAVDDEAVERLARSMNEIGLRTPISVRQADGGPVQLVTGLHRLNAAKSIGWDHIDCFVFENETDIEAEMWEIAENLHRAGLSKEQRDEHIRRYARLVEMRREVIVSQNAKQLDPRPVGRPKGVTAEVAEATGLSWHTVNRALAPNQPKPAADPITDIDAAERQYARIIAAWNAAGTEARNRFRDYIDTPVMDNAPCGGDEDMPAFLRRRA